MDARVYMPRLLKAASTAIIGFAMVCGLLILFGGLTWPASAAPLADTIVAADVIGNAAWTTAGSPYIISGTVSVYSGTLTVAPNVTVRFNADSELIIQASARLVAVGTSSQPITFTSNVIPGPTGCYWDSIRLNSNNNVIQYSLVEYATWGLDLREPYGENDISYNRFRNNGLCTISPEGGAIVGSTDVTTISHNTFINNASAIRLAKSSDNRIAYNLISGTTRSGIAFVRSLATSSSDNQVYSNTVRGSQDAGIVVELGDFNDIFNNLVYNNRGEGIQVTDQRNTTLVDNRVYGNAFSATPAPTAALEVRDSQDVTVQGNSIYGNGASGLSSYRAGLYVNGTQSVHITNNFIHDNVLDDGLEYGLGNSGTPVIAGNAICRDPAFELRSQQVTTLTAEGNWWGTNTPAGEITGNVDYNPWIHLSLAPTSSSIRADGTSTTTLQITFNDGAGRVVPLPARVISVAASAGSLSSPTATVDGTGHASLTLTSAAAPGTAVVTATDVCGYSVTDTVTFAGYVDLSVTKTASGPPYGPGDLITYTISYRNNGNAPASGVVLTETLPVSTSFAGRPSGWTRVGSTNQYIYSAGAVPAGSSTLNRTFVVSIAGNLPAGTSTFTNVVRVGSAGLSGPDFDPTDNIYTLTVSGGNLPDLWVVKNDNVGPTSLSGPMVGALANSEGGPDYLRLIHTMDSFGAQAVPEGGLITYTIGYGNGSQGSAPATGVVLSETLPLYTTYAGPACGEPGGWCQIDASRTYTRFVGGPWDPLTGDYAYFRVRVTNSLPQTVSQVINTVCIYGNEGDLIPANNCSTEETEVISGTYDLSVTKAANATCLNAGDGFYYLITVRNDGANDATHVILRETLPAHTSAINLSGSGWTDTGSGVYTYSLGVVPSGVITTARFWVQIDPDLTSSVSVITNSVSVEADGTDSNPANNSFTLVTPVGTTPDLAITKNDNILDRVDPGGVISYTIAYVNNSHRYTSTNVVVTETLPAGTVITGPAVSQWHRVGSTNRYTYFVGSMSPNQVRSVEFLVQVDDPFLYGSEVVNRVEIGGAESECNTDNNVATEETPVLGANAADLEVTKVDNIPFCAVPGDWIEYTIAYTNNSYTIDAENVTLTERIDPAVVTFLGPTGWTPAGVGTYRRSPATPTVGTREGGTFDFNVAIAYTIPPGQEYITNVVRIDTTSDDWNLSNNVYTLSTYVPEWPDLIVVKNDNVGSTGLTAMAGLDQLLARLQFSPQAQTLLDSSLSQSRIGAMAESVNPGDTITYTIILGNIGRATSSGVVLTETLPPGTTFLGPGYWHQVGASDQYTYLSGNLSAGFGDVIQFIVRVDNPFLAGSRVVNTVQIGGNGAECDTTNNTSSDETPVVGGGYSNSVYLPLILKDYPPAIPTPVPTAPTAPPPPTPTPTPMPLAWVSDVAVDSASGHVFVASPREDAVHVINGGPDEYNRSIGVAHGPTGLAVLTSTSPSKVFVAHAYAYNYWRPGVWVIDALNLTGHSMADQGGYVGAAPIKVAVNSTARRAFVSNYFDRMAILNAPNETWIASVPERNFQASYGIDASERNNLVYIAARDTGELIIFDAAAAELDPQNYSPCHHAPPGADSANTSRIVRMVAVNETTGHVFVTSPPDPNKSSQTDSKVFVLDEATLLAETARHGGRPSAETCLWNFGVMGEDIGIAAIPGPAWVKTLDLPAAASAGEEGIAVNPLTGRVYVTDGAGDQLFVLQDSPTPASIGWVATVTVGDNPQGVGVNPVTNKIYVANARNLSAPYGTVSVVNGATNAVIKTINLGP
jgi:uncharacterized repeat protein (TIGR01451 family)